jgi:hypothetical protein
MRLMHYFFYLTGQGMEAQGSRWEFMNTRYIHHAYFHASTQPAHAAIFDVHFVFDWVYLNALIHVGLQKFPIREGNLRQPCNGFSAVSNLRAPLIIQISSQYCVAHKKLLLTYSDVRRVAIFCSRLVLLRTLNY